MIKMLKKMWNDDRGISGPFSNYIIAVAMIALLVPPFVQKYPKMRWEIILLSILLSIVVTVIIIKLEYPHTKNITKKIEKNETEKNETEKI